MSLVSDIILNSDDELRYPTIGELEWRHFWLDKKLFFS